jgi:aminopeptidase N
MATNMVALRALLGSDTFMSSYRTYGLRWLERHPTQYDFFNSFDALSGTDLSWFWRTWWYETWTLDQAIGSVTTSGDQLEVTIEDRGTAPMPVRLAITRTDGRVEHQEIPVSVWLTGARKYTVALRSAATVRSIEIDPDHVFPDIDRSNNRWTKP